MTLHRFTIAAAAAALALLPLAGPAAAQAPAPKTHRATPVIPLPAAAKLQAKITAIDTQTRNITLTGANGEAVTFTAGHLVDLSRLKVGDTVNVTYYRSVAFLVAGPGKAAPEDRIGVALERHVQTPGGDGLMMTRISATVVGIDLAGHSIDVVTPSGGPVHTFVVTVPSRVAMLSKLKIGDTVTAVVSESLAISVEPAKSLF